MSIETPIDRVGSRGFRAAKRGGTEGNLITDQGEGQAEMVLSNAEGAEHNTD